MKTRLFLTLTALLLALSSYAAGTRTQIGGIYYNLDSSTKTASVTYTGSSSRYNPSSTAYKGSIIIPASVTYQNETYSVTSIGYGAFSDCTGLTSITIPSSVTSIGDQAFDSCSGLTSITIPNSVTWIGIFAFSGCTSLTSITIPNSVTYIGNNAFSGCTGLTSITIGNSVTWIENNAFSHCSGLTSITIPNSVTSIGNSAFYGCTSLTSIDIPNSVTSIGKYAFDGCTGLTSIDIPNSVIYIGREAFFLCTGLTSITIPESVTSIGNWAFEYCTGLTSITVLRTDPEAYNCERDAFDNVPTSTCTLHVPKGSKEAYKAIEPWNRFANIVEEEDLTAIQSLTLSPSEAGESYYNLQGQRIAEPQKGIVIVRYSDGTSRKMYVR